MAEQWRFARVEDPLRKALATPSVAGVLVCGPDGSGKSTAIRAALADSRLPVTWIAAPAPLRTIPFGSFSGLVRVEPKADTPGAIWSVLEALRATLPANGVLVVDDCQYLDPASAIVVHQLIAQRRAQVVLAAPAAAALPAVLRPLAADSAFARVDLSPLSLSETAELLSSRTGHPIAPASVERLQALSGGNLLLLTMMGTAASRGGAWLPIPGTDAVHLARDAIVLEDLFAARRDALLDLEPDAVRLISYLAVTGSLNLAECAELGCGSGASALIEHGLVVLQQPGATLRIATPLLGAAVLAGLDEWRARTLRGDLVRARQARALDPAQELALVALSLRSDEQLPVERILGCVDLALRLGAVDTAIEIARHADALAPGPGSVLALASSLSWRGDAEESAAVYDRLLDADLPAPLGDIWAVMRAANIFWGLREAEGAWAAIAAADAHLPLTGAATAAFAAFEGRLAEAIARAEGVLSSGLADAAATLWASVGLSIAAAYGMDQARQSVAWEAGMAAAAATSSGYQRWSFFHDAVWLALMSGRIEDARDLTDAAAEAAAGEPTATALSAMLRGLVLFEEGEIAAARSMAAEAHAVLREQAPAGWTMLSALLRVRTEVESGAVDAALEILREAESLFTPALGVYEPLLRSAAGWVHWGAGDLAHARQCFAEATALAARQGSVVFLAEAELSAWRTLGIVPSLSPADSAPTRAIADCLREKSERAQATAGAIGQAGFALLAAELAASLRCDTGPHPFRSEPASASPLPATLAQRITPTPISPREREVVLAVRLGLSNAEIADRLCLSVRTVEGHILRACDKLGVRGRKGLRDLTTV